MRTRTQLTLLLGSLLLLFAFARPAASQGSDVIYTIEVDGVINQALSAFLTRAIDTAETANAEALVIQLDTPGGEVSAMLEIVQTFRNAEVPILVFVGPRGAQAASAGSVITLAAHASAMAPETVIGAASPVTGGGEDIQETLYNKLTEDLKATVRGLAADRGEEAITLAERMIDEAAAVTGPEALEVGFIDVVAEDVPDMLAQLNGRSVTLNGEARILNTANATLLPLEPTPAETFLYTLATILMQPLFISALIGIGVQAIIYEVTNPGGWVAGFVGFICIGLALYGLSFLPANYLGLALIVAAFILLIMEVFTPTYGALGLTGAVTLLAGLLVTFNSPGNPEFARISIPSAVAVTAVTSGFFLFIMGKAIATRRQPVYSGPEGLVGKIGRARSSFAPSGGAFEGTVFVYGALWQAEADAQIEKGDKVTIKQVDGIRLHVGKVE